MNRRISPALLFAAALLSGCSFQSHNGNKKDNSTAMLFSPNGEPLNGGPLGKPSCKDAMTGWFERVDANHAGAVSREEFLADARLQFQRMDIDHNGYLLAEEVDRFRLPYQQQGPSGASSSSDGDSGTQKAGQRGGKRSASPGGGDVNPLDQPDPVMSADANNDFKVTPEEFTAQAESVFADLDTDHNGALSREEVIKTCEKKGR